MRNEICGTSIGARPTTLHFLQIGKPNMPLTAKGEKILHALKQEYGERAERILYAGKNKGTFTGIDDADVERAHRHMKLDAICDEATRLGARIDAYCDRRRA